MFWKIWHFNFITHYIIGKISCQQITVIHSNQHCLVDISRFPLRKDNQNSSLAFTPMTERQKFQPTSHYKFLNQYDDISTSVIFRINACI